jgi:uncharacterized membrane protein
MEARFRRGALALDFLDPVARPIAAGDFRVLGILGPGSALYVSLFGSTPPDSFTRFIGDVLSTPQGWKLIGFGTAIGFVFAVVALSISVVSFPLLLDRDVEVPVAVLTSVRAVWENPFTMALWGLIVAAVLGAMGKSW